MNTREISDHIEAALAGQRIPARVSVTVDERTGVHTVRVPGHHVGPLASALERLYRMIRVWISGGETHGTFME